MKNIRRLGYILAIGGAVATVPLYLGARITKNSMDQDFTPQEQTVARVLRTYPEKVEDDFPEFRDCIRQMNTIESCVKTAYVTSTITLLGASILISYRRDGTHIFGHDQDTR